MALSYVLVHGQSHKRRCNFVVLISIFLGGPLRHGARLGSVYLHRGEFNFFLDAKLQELGLVGQQVVPHLGVDPTRPVLVNLDLRHDGLLDHSIVIKLA